MDITRLFAKILAVITRRPRQKVVAGIDFEWSETWVHNIFRIYEIIFWRREGIRFESSAATYFDKETNETIQVHSFGTWESLFAHAEGMVRILFKGMIPRLVKVPLPIPVFAGGYMGIDTRGAYVFAIAFDTTGANKDNGGVVTSKDIINYTATGSNLIMTEHGGTNSSGNGATVTHSSFTYDSAAATGNPQTQSSGQHKVSLWYLIAPTTAANKTATFTISAALTGGGQQLSLVIMTYSGCKQSAQPDSSNKNNSASSVDPFPVTTTVVASNCWLSGSALDEATFNSGTAGSGTTYRSAIQFNHQAADSNGTVGTGSQSLNWGEGAGGSVVGGAAMSIAPVAAAATVTPHFLPMIGAGS